MFIFELFVFPFSVCLESYICPLSPLQGDLEGLFVFRQFINHQLIRLIGQFQHQLIVQRSIHIQRVPVCLVHVKCTLNRRILFPKLNGPFRITFQNNAPVAIQIGQSPHFAHYFKYQGRSIKWKFSGNPRFRHAVFREFFNIHMFDFKSLKDNNIPNW